MTAEPVAPPTTPPTTPPGVTLRIHQAEALAALAAAEVRTRQPDGGAEQESAFTAAADIFEPLGGDFVTAFQLITFQGVRYSLFAFNSAGDDGGFADFDSIQIHEPDPRGLKPIPYGKHIVLASTLDGEPAHLLTVHGLGYRLDV